MEKPVNTDTDDNISYKGIDESELIHALYHGTRPLGMGYLHNMDALSLDDVRLALAERDECSRYDFDYFFGRPLKLRLDTVTKTFRARLYDRDAGIGAAQAIVDGLRGKAA